MLVTINEVRVGNVAPLGEKGARSAINKNKVSHTVLLGKNGLDNDHQADRKYHGGFDKAVHHYPADHYQYWQEVLDGEHSSITTGLFGENITTLGLTEHNVYIGDIYKVGSALVQVSQARQPCWKLNERFQQDNMALQVQTSLRTGWYYRVLEIGYVKAGDSLILIDRIEEQWPLIRLLRVLFETPLDYEELDAMTKIATLTDSWKMLANHRLKHRQVEPWHHRLNTPLK
jgi:MOSC domain-containing protein YiiM